MLRDATQCTIKVSFNAKKREAITFTCKYKCSQFLTTLSETDRDKDNKKKKHNPTQKGFYRRCSTVSTVNAANNIQGVGMRHNVRSEPLYAKKREAITCTCKYKCSQVLTTLRETDRTFGPSNFLGLNRLHWSPEKDICITANNNQCVGMRHNVRSEALSMPRGGRP